MSDLTHANTLFHIKSLTKTYEMGEIKVHALRGIDLSLDKGELVVLLGPSGSGKSTLMNIMGGIDKATTGNLYYLDQDLTKQSDKQLTIYRRRHIGFVFQFYNLLSNLTAQENIEAVTELVPDYMSAKEALNLVQLYNRRSHFPSQLSGGEQQRVAIARAIAKKPNVLLCDEPTGALDIQTGIVVLKALRNINDQLNTSIIIITHNAEISMMADRVIHLQDGLIKESYCNANKISPEDLTW